MLYILIYFLIIFITIKLFKHFGLIIFGKNMHPIGILIFFNIYLFSLAGVLIIYLGEFQSFINLGNIILTEKTINTITFWYFYSVFILFFTLMFFVNYMKNFSISTPLVDEYKNSKFIFLLIILKFIFIIILFSYIGFNNIPILNMINGDVTMARILKKQIMDEVIPGHIPYVTNFFKFLFPFSTLYIFNIFLTIKSKNKKYIILLIMSFLFDILYYTYKVEKSPLFIFSLTLIFLYISHKGINKNVYFFGGILTFIFVVFYTLYMQADFNSFVIESILSRLFIGQNLGMYYIYQLIEPSSDYLLNGLPLINRFMEVGEKADEVVMIKIFGESLTNVNMNTYYLGEAYSSMGEAGFLISPFIVSFWIMAFMLLFRYLIRINYFIFYPASFVIFSDLQMSQGFNFFLYGKWFLLPVVSILIIYYLYKLIK